MYIYKQSQWIYSEPRPCKLHQHCRTIQGSVSRKKSLAAWQETGAHNLQNKWPFIVWRVIILSCCWYRDFFQKKWEVIMSFSCPPGQTGQGMIQVITVLNCSNTSVAADQWVLRPPAFEMLLWCHPTNTQGLFQIISKLQWCFSPTWEKISWGEAASLLSEKLPIAS